MTVQIALLRAVNVGGTGKLAMTELARLCTSVGLADVRTYIQSGNVVFRSELTEADLICRLEGALAARMGQPVGVLIRTAAELQAVLDANPFPAAPPAQVGVQVLTHGLSGDLVARIGSPGREDVRAVGRHLVIHFPDGMGRSRLKLPAAAASGTMRNMNTVARLVAMADEMRDTGGRVPEQALEPDRAR